MTLTRTYARLSATRNVTSELVLDSGLDYTMPFEWVVYKVEQRSVGATWINTSFTQSSGTLSATFTFAPDSTHPVVIYFYIFMTDKFTAYEKDSITTGSVVEWKPWIQTSPSVTMSIRDVLEGQLDVSPSKFTFINEKSLLPLFDDKTSFYDKQAVIWVDFGEGSGIESFYNGRIVHMPVSSRSIAVQMKNALHKLNNLPSMGMNDSYQYNRSAASSVDDGMPIPFVWGNVTPHYPVYGAGANQPISTAAPVYDKSKAIKCTHASGTVGSAVDYYACRAPDFTLNPLIPFSIVSGGGAGNTTATITIVSDTLMRNVICGDQQCEVWDGSFWLTVDTSITNLPLRTVVVTLSGAGTFGGTLTQFRHRSGVFLFTDHADYDPGGAYFSGNVQVVTDTSGSYKRITVQPGETKCIKGNSGSVFFDPTKHPMYAVITNDNSYLHGTVIQQIVESLGLSVNSASITAANSTLPKNVFMTIPGIRDKEYKKTALEVIGDILKSTGGYIYTNDDEEVVYDILGTSSATHSISDTDIIDGTLNVSYDFRDVKTQIRARQQNFYDLVAGTRDEYIRNEVEYRMHDVDKTHNYESVLEDNGSVPQTRLNYVSRARTRFSMRLPVSFKTMQPGDFADIESSQLVGMDLTNLMVTEITRSVLHVDVTLTKIEIT
jgi:hypothetical protein